MHQTASMKMGLPSLPVSCRRMQLIIYQAFSKYYPGIFYPGNIT